MGDAATPVPPDFTNQTDPTYKINIDAGFAVADRLAWAFAPHEQATPDMTVRLDAGSIWDVDSDTLSEVSAANTATLTAPSVNPRKDIIYIDDGAGAIGVATGAEAASPVDPTVPAGKAPVARINWTTSMTEITNADLDDLRPGLRTGWLKPDGDGSQLTGIVAVPSGSIMDYAGSSAPSGWVLCDGAAYDSVTDTSFAALFAAIANVYGGTDGADFKVPDLRGRATVGKDDMGGTAASRIISGDAHGVDGAALGAAGGVGEHQLTTAELASHTHSYGGSNASPTSGGGTRDALNFGAYNSGSTGSDNAHTNLQPSMILNKIIKK